MAEVAEVIDSDSHVYEPAAVWDDFVPLTDGPSGSKLAQPFAVET